MKFWEYDESVASGDVKSKRWTNRLVAKVHEVFRTKLGFVDQADVKATVMALTSEQSVQ